MQYNAIKICFTEWVTQDSWNSHHWCDKERFERGSRRAISQLGTQVLLEQFIPAIEELVRELHPKISQSYAKEAVRKHYWRLWDGPIRTMQNLQ